MDLSLQTWLSLHRPQAFLITYGHVKIVVNYGFFFPANYIKYTKISTVTSQLS